MVMAGGAVATACIEIGERAKRIGAKLLQLDPAMVTLRDGRVCGPKAASGSPKSRIPGTAGRRTCRPMSIRAGWKRPSGYKPHRDTGTFSYATHAVDRRGRSRPRRRRNSRLRRGRGRRQAGQSDGRGWPDSMAASRKGSARRSTRKCRSTPPDNRSHRPSPIICCRGRPKCRAADRPHGDGFALYGFGVKGIGEGGASRRRRLSPTRSTMRCGRLARNSGIRRFPRGELSRPSWRRVSKERPSRMKAAAFAYERPSDLGAALELIAAADGRQRLWPGGNRWGPCSTCGWSSRS